MEFRRSARAHLAPFVVLASIGVSALAVLAGASRSGVVVLCALFIFYWVLFSTINWLRRLVIDDRTIQLYGYLGGPIVMARNEIQSCSYRLFRANFRGSPDVYFFELRDGRGRSLPIWRYGWGGRGSAMFDELANFLRDSSCTMIGDAQAHLDRIARPR